MASRSSDSQSFMTEIRKAVREEVSRALVDTSATSPSTVDTVNALSNSSASTEMTNRQTQPSSSCTATASTSTATASCSGNTTMTFEDFYKKRERSRQEDFNPKSKKKQKNLFSSKEMTNKDVEIKVSLAYQSDGGIKPRRGKSQVIRVKGASTRTEIVGKAVAKHALFDQTFDDSVAYVLLYPDFSEVNIIPGTNDTFTLSAFKEASGREYRRLAFYLMPFDEFYDADANPQATNQVSQSVDDMDCIVDCWGAGWDIDFDSTSGASGTVATDADDSLLNFAIQQSKECEQKAELQQKSLTEALKERLETYSPDDYTLIELTRKDLVSKTFESLEDEVIKSHVIVKFFGEEAVDTGGVTRKYFTEFFKGISVCSDIVRGCYPNITFRHNLRALRVEKFELLGKLMAVSALSGCPGPHMFSPSLVNSLFDLPTELSLDEVPLEFEYLPQLSKIVKCTDDKSFFQAVNEFPERFDMGYTKAVVNLKDKGELIDTCARHIMVSSVAEEILSFKKGQMSFGVYDIMSNFSDEAVRHFIHTDVSVEEVKKCFEPVYSVAGSEKHEKEVEIVYKWHHFLKSTSKGKLQSSVLSYYELQSPDEPDPEEKTLSLSDITIWKWL